MFLPSSRRQITSGCGVPVARQRSRRSPFSFVVRRSALSSRSMMSGGMTTSMYPVCAQDPRADFDGQKRRRFLIRCAGEINRHVHRSRSSINAPRVRDYVTTIANCSTWLDNDANRDVEDTRWSRYHCLMITTERHTADKDERLDLCERRL